MMARIFRLPGVQMLWKPLRRGIRAMLPNDWRLELAETALRLPLPQQAWQRLRTSVQGYHGSTPRGMWLAARLSDRLGDEQTARKLRSDRLLILLLEREGEGDLDQVVALMGEIEKFGRTAPYAAGQRIALMLSTPVKRARLLKAVKKARKRHKRSVFLLHLASLIAAIEGNYREAAEDLVREIAHVRAQPQTPETLLRLTSLQNAWRVVDRSARDQMDWAMADDDEASSIVMPVLASSDANAVVPASQDTVSEPGSTDDGTGPQAYEETVVDIETEAVGELEGIVSFEERALQTRRRKDYLEMCRVRFSKAGDLPGRVKAVQDMLRTGARHIPHYGSSYTMAAEHFDRLESDLAEIMDSRALPARPELESICAALRVAERLRRDGPAEEIRSWLTALAGRPGVGCLAWEAADAMARERGSRAAANTIMDRIGHLLPVINRDVKNYLSWAMHCHRHDEAHAFVRRLPAKLRRTHGLLYYVHILQRESRFDEALDLLRQIHAQALTNPLRANPVTNASLIKRTGELEFLSETARLHSAVPQPTRPEGLILIMARNIDQLRRVPLTALVEFKRRNWAVIPLVEGLLPVEPTGIAEIDRLIGAITPHAWLTPEAERAMPDLRGFRFEPGAGRLTWAEFDLSHPLWEDAAINRRRHSVDWSCPELQHYLGGLSDWTRAMGRALEHARKVGQQRKLRIGTISLFNARLPDALPRFLCESRGHPDRFFQLYAANGYQNYFTNFSTNISQRFVLRNMTRHPEARSASFPLPENFEAYYANRRREAPALLEQHQAVTRVNRSTIGQKERPPEALAARQHILDWRARGGKVACAFGKVVFDAGVPFDGGPCHRDLKDWLNHCIHTVQDSNTLLLIKPHPHELNNQVATFPTEYFADLIEGPLGRNAMFLGHRWFDMNDMRELIDLGVIYSGTSTIELGIMGIPAILAGHFAPIDYPIGQIAPQRREEYEAYLRFERPAQVASDLALRAAVWLDYMANEEFTQAYRFHARPVTNKVLYPPYWFRDDLRAEAAGRNTAAQVLVDRALGLAGEPVRPPLAKPKPLPEPADFDKRYQNWLEDNPDGLFSEFFDSYHVPKILAGARHASLGTNLQRGDWETAGEGGLALTRRIWSAITGQVDLPRDLTVCDFGCGTLRIGAHFISHLEPGRYLGLDVSAALIGMGQENFAPLIAEKCPQFAVLNRDFAPGDVPPADLIVAYNVACHIHPDEEAEFYRRLKTIAARPGALIFLHVMIYPQPLRYQESGWADTRQSFVARMAPFELVEHPHEMLGTVQKGPHRVAGITLAFRRPAEVEISGPSAEAAE